MKKLIYLSILFTIVLLVCMACSTSKAQKGIIQLQADVRNEETGLRGKWYSVLYSADAPVLVGCVDDESDSFSLAVFHAMESKGLKSGIVNYRDMEKGRLPEGWTNASEGYVLIGSVTKVENDSVTAEFMLRRIAGWDICAWLRVTADGPDNISKIASAVAKEIALRFGIK